MADVLNQTNNFGVQYGHLLPWAPPLYIQANYHTFGRTPPDSSRYMDTRAASHMTFDVGNFFSYSNLSTNNGITAKNDHSIPISGRGNDKIVSFNPPFLHIYVLYALKQIMNLIYVGKFTTNEMSQLLLTPSLSPYFFTALAPSLCMLVWDI